MTYSLKERNDRVSALEITQGDFSKVENGQKRYEDSSSGGDSILPEIKKLAEGER
jgi:hypothetical protein